MYANVAKAYAQNQAQGTNKAKQVAMVLDLAIASLREAEQAIHDNQIVRRFYRVRRAREIVLTLKSGLDFSVDAELARNLDTVYVNCLQRMTWINTKNEPQYVQEVIRLLEPLRDAWYDAAKQQTTGTPAQQPGQTTQPHEPAEVPSGINLAT